MSEQDLARCVDALDHISRAAGNMKQKYRSGFSDFARKRADKVLAQIGKEPRKGNLYDVIEKLNTENYKLKLENDELKQVINGLKGRK